VPKIQLKKEKAINRHLEGALEPRSSTRGERNASGEEAHEQSRKEIALHEKGLSRTSAGHSANMKKKEKREYMESRKGQNEEGIDDEGVSFERPRQGCRAPNKKRGRGCTTRTDVGESIGTRSYNRGKTNLERSRVGRKER